MELKKSQGLGEIGRIIDKNSHFGNGIRLATLSGWITHVVWNSPMVISTKWCFYYAAITSRNFYNILKSKFFSAILYEAAWNDGIVEFWNTGHGKREMAPSTKNVESTFFDNTHQAAIFYFCHT